MQIPVYGNGKQGTVDEYRYLLRLVTVALLAVTGCSKPHPLNPTYEELVHRGFYIYVLPSNEVAARKWQETVSIWSWDRHCSGVELSETANPIRVVYTGESDQPELRLTIGPWSMAWDHRQSTTAIQLNTEWARTGSARYYVVEGYLNLAFEDRFGIPVRIGSRHPVTEVVHLINQLEYIGPPSETVGNPWDYARCPGQ